MKKVFNSIGQVFQQIKKDPMMLTACFTPFLVGALIKFGIPLIEKAAKFSLQPYYPMFDLFLSIMAPVLLCFAFAMITLEEIDDKVSRYFSITPLGKSGYIFSRLGIPAILSTVVTFIVMLIFSLEKRSVIMVSGLSVLGAVQAIMVALMIITLSGNKLEGMAVTKLAALTLLGIPAPFLIDSYCQFAVGFLPSFWAAKAVQNEAVLYFPMALAAALIWYYFLTKRLFQKLAG